MGGMTDSQPAGRNLVVCCDGTGNRFGWRNTNVVLLASTLVHDPERQIVYYDPGVGTLGDPGITSEIRRLLGRLVDLAIGRTVRDNVGQALAFLAHYWQPGDRIYLFGFSRGAYTVRALAGLISLYGLPEAANENLTPYLWDMYSHGMRGDDASSDGAPEGDARHNAFRIAGRFKATFSRRPLIHFVGVWDTVSSVGWFWDPLVLANTRTNHAIEHGRHAVSIDERRAFFRQNLWHKSRVTQDLKEVWFAGVHSDIGGGYPAAESGLAKITLEWMLREVRPFGLLMDEERAAAVLAADAPPNATAPMHQSMTPGWWIAEIVPRLRYNAKVHARRLSMNAFRTRWMGERPRVHRSVVERIEGLGGAYRPSNLPTNGAYDVEE